VNIAVKNTLGVVKNCSGIVCKDDLALCALFTDERFVVFNVINSGEAVLLVAEKLAVLASESTSP
jgi:hypothetical protein